MKMGTDNDALSKYQRLLEFESQYRSHREAQPIFSLLLTSSRKYISNLSLKKSLLSFFPIFTTLKNYKIKEDLLNDVIAGVTSGTGRQLSWGCIAVLSLMIGSILEKYDNSINGGNSAFCLNTSADTGTWINATNSSHFINDSLPVSSNSGTSLSPEDLRRIEIASGVSVVAGILLIVMSLIGLSRITCLMSNSLITGFTVGISFHVATSQFKSVLGIQIKRHSGILSLVFTWIDVLKNIPYTNIATLLTAVISIIVIYLVKKLINERFKSRLRVPIPIELIVLITGTLISKYAQFHKEYNVSVVREIPVGLPAPNLPDLGLVTDYIGDGFIIIIIAFAQSLAMAKTMGLKHNYVIDSNQEMFASGACTLVCGIFSGYICGASVSRSVVQDGAGGRTQVASLFAAGLVLLVIMVLGPFFYHLPMCILSAIILVNLRSMFMKILDIPKEWRKSKYDCADWVFACFATIIFNADIGLFAGVAFSLFLVALRAMLTPIVESGQIQTSPLTVELRSIDRYSKIILLKDVRIFKIRTPLYFVNADIFTSAVFTKTGINPIKLRKKMKASQTIIVEADKPIKFDAVNSELLLEKPEPFIKALILHAAEVAFIDVMGVQALQLIITEFTSVGIEVLITAVPESILPILKSTGFLARNGERLFLSVESALASIVTAVSPITETLSAGDSS
ncbi:hypothetical protein Btru_003631 [Bulinus truncatus]|nr:hypothetical protein Btru_003631 [Bulinus truncatus]